LIPKNVRRDTIEGSYVLPVVGRCGPEGTGEVDAHAEAPGTVIASNPGLIPRGGIGSHVLAVRAGPLEGTAGSGEEFGFHNP
jgi:hypothetical protein